MNIVSCDNCGVLLDADTVEWKLVTFQGGWDDEESTVCPVCYSNINREVSDGELKDMYAFIDLHNRLVSDLRKIVERLKTIAGKKRGYTGVSDGIRLAISEIENRLKGVSNG
jgi:hypothetical protein